MGYAQLNQRGHGIHTRLYARTFIVEDERQNRVVYVSVDAGMISHAVKRNVIRELQKKFGATYRYENVMISGTREYKLDHILSIKLSIGYKIVESENSTLVIILISLTPLKKTLLSCYSSHNVKLKAD